MAEFNWRGYTSLGDFYQDWYEGEIEIDTEDHQYLNGYIWERIRTGTISKDEADLFVKEEDGFMCSYQDLVYTDFYDIDSYSHMELRIYRNPFSTDGYYGIECVCAHDGGVVKCYEFMPYKRVMREAFEPCGPAQGSF